MPSIPIIIIALFFLTGGIAHFSIPEFFIKAMPDYLSHQYELVIISGVFEILGAIGILIPKTRKFAGYGLMALIISVFPANINMALHPESFSNIPELLLYIRLPLQFIFLWFVWWAIKASKGHPHTF